MTGSAGRERHPSSGYLKEYTPYLLDQLIAVVTASTLMAYAHLYHGPRCPGAFGNRPVFFTTPFVIYAFSDTYIGSTKDQGGIPRR
jgi:hypothetical protein